MALDLGKSLYAKLSGTTGITAIVPSTKICPMVIPQGESLPAITYQLIVETPHHAMSNDALLRDPTWQVSSWSTSYAQVKSLSNEIRKTLRDFSGVLATSGVTVKRIFLDNEVEFADFDSNTNKYAYHVAQRYVIWHTT